MERLELLPQKKTAMRARRSIHIDLCLGVFLGALLSLAGCSRLDQRLLHTDSLPGRMAILIDGSSTVYPLSQRIGAEFTAQFGTPVSVHFSGTGGGFQRLCRGEIALADASRPITAEEAQMCHDYGQAYIEIPIAYDAISVVVNRRNAWLTTMTVAELRRLWAKASENSLVKWNQIRPEWPEETIHLYGPGKASGTLDYFVQAILGEQDKSREDYIGSEDDAVLVEGVAHHTGALGYFGLAYYQKNTERLKAVAIDDLDDTNGIGPQWPAEATVRAGRYQPLARPLFLYIATKALKRPEVSQFVDYYLTRVAAVSQEVGYISIPPEALDIAKQRVHHHIVGSAFGAQGVRIGVRIEDLLRLEIDDLLQIKIK